MKTGEPRDRLQAATRAIRCLHNVKAGLRQVSREDKYLMFLAGGSGRMMKSHDSLCSGGWGIGERRLSIGIEAAPGLIRLA